MFCSQCGTANADGAQFCSKCGAALGNAPASTNPVLTAPGAAQPAICPPQSRGKALGRLTGRGMAMAGLILGYIGVAMIPFILIVAAIAIPNLLRARMAANQAGA